MGLLGKGLRRHGDWIRRNMIIIVVQTVVFRLKDEKEPLIAVEAGRYSLDCIGP